MHKVTSTNSVHRQLIKLTSYFMELQIGNKSKSKEIKFKTSEGITPQAHDRTDSGPCPLAGFG